MELSYSIYLEPSMVVEITYGASEFIWVHPRFLLRFVLLIL